MAQNSWAALGTTDPRDHREGWRYLMVEVNAAAARLRQLAGAQSRLGQAVIEDPYAANPDWVGVDISRRSDYASQVRIRDFRLIDEEHPPRAAGLIVALPDDRVRLNGGQGYVEDGYYIMQRARPGRPASGLSGVSLGPGTQILGVVVPEYERTHECHTETHDTGGPGSVWDAEWAEVISGERGVPLIRTAGSNPASYDPIVDIEPLVLVHDPLGWSLRVPLEPGDFDMSLSHRATEGGIEGLYPLTGEGVFRRGERRPLLLSPEQMAWALGALATAGGSEDEVREVAASYERTVDDNEKPRVTGSGPEKGPFTITANSGYGLTEATLTINPEGAYRSSRHHPNPGRGVAEDPERVLAVVEYAKHRYPDEAKVIGALHEYIRARNAAEWALLETYNGRIPTWRVAKAQKFAGVPLDDNFLQQAGEFRDAQLRRAVGESTQGSNTAIVYDTPESPAALTSDPYADWQQFLEEAIGTNPGAEEQEPPNPGRPSPPKHGGFRPGGGSPGEPGPPTPPRTAGPSRRNR